MVEARLRRVVKFVLGHKTLVVVGIVLVTLAALSVYPQAVIASSLKSMFFGEHHAAYNSYLDRVAKFGSDEVFLFGLAVDEPMSTETLDRLERFHQLAEADPEVRRVQSIWNLERVGLIGETIGVRKFSELAREDPSKIPKLLEEIRGDPIAGGLFISKTHPDVLVIVEIRPDSTRSAEAGPLKVAQMRGHFETVGFAPEIIYPGGFMAVLAEMIHVSEDNLTRLFPVICLCLLLAVFLMFGKLWPVLVTTLSAVIAVIWTGAFAISMDPEINILMSILPALVMIISFSDVVHICSAYLLNLGAGQHKEEALTSATVEVGAACLLTSVTTGVGFLALTFVPAPAFANLGLVAAFGVVIAYVIAMLIVPICLDVLPEPDTDWHAGRTGWVQSGLDRVLEFCADVTTTRPYAMIAVFTAFFAFLLYGCSLIVFETEFEKRLADDNPARIAQDYMQERFIEASIIELYIDTKTGVLDAKTFAALTEFEATLESWPEIDKSVSFVDLMRATHRSIVGADAVFGPFDDAALAQMMVLLDMQGPDAMESFLDFERRSTRFTLYSTVEGVVAQHRLKLRIEALGHELLGPEIEVEATGVGSLMGGWIDDILAGQRQGLGFSLLVIMLLLIIGFRSVRAGVVSMVPNIIPLVAAGAYCGYMWDQTDSDTLIIAMIALGIGVDDTIHFISRFQVEARRRERLEAIREAFRYSGRGIFITTFVFVVGFVPCMLSDYYSLWIFGLLLPICFVVALLADVLLVPALCAVGWIR